MGRLRASLVALRDCRSNTALKLRARVCSCQRALVSFKRLLDGPPSYDHVLVLPDSNRSDGIVDDLGGLLFQCYGTVLVKLDSSEGQNPPLTASILIKL
jgi:hypothetical protein